MRIRVTTRADLYEKRKEEHIDRGYRIEEERPIPVNGLCSFIVVRELPDSEAVGELAIGTIPVIAAVLPMWRILGQNPGV